MWRFGGPARGPWHTTAWAPPPRSRAGTGRSRGSDAAAVGVLVDLVVGGGRGLGRGRVPGRGGLPGRGGEPAGGATAGPGTEAARRRRGLASAGHACDSEVQLLAEGFARVKSDAGHARYVQWRNCRGE